MMVGPGAWDALDDTTPAAREAWVQRLGGGGDAFLAVVGAIHRGQLVADGAGGYRLAVRRPVQLDLALGGRNVPVG